MDKPRTYTIFSGVNGSGKSTLHRVLKRDFGVRINLDEIIREQFNNDWRRPKTKMDDQRMKYKRCIKCKNHL